MGGPRRQQAIDGLEADKCARPPASPAGRVYRSALSSANRLRTLRCHLRIPDTMAAGGSSEAPPPAGCEVGGGMRPLTMVRSAFRVWVELIWSAPAVLTETEVASIELGLDQPHAGPTARRQLERNGWRAAAVRR